MGNIQVTFSVVHIVLGVSGFFFSMIGTFIMALKAAQVIFYKPIADKLDELGVDVAVNKDTLARHDTLLKILQPIVMGATDNDKNK